MRILHLNEHGFVAGGAEQYLLGAILRLEASGTQNLLVHAQPLPEGTPDLLVRRRLVAGLAREAAPPRGIPADLAAVLDQERPDVVYFHECVHPGVLRALAARVPVVKFVHGVRPTCPSGLRFWRDEGHLCDRHLGLACQGQAYRHRCMPRNPTIGLPLIARARELAGAIAAAHRTIVPSGYLRDLLVEHGVPPSRIEVLPYFVEPPPPELGGVPPPGRMLLACAARLTQEKGAFVVVEALRQLPPGACLVVIGDGPEAGEIRANVAALGLEGRVALPGWLPQREVLRAFASADVVLFPSQCAESFGIVGIEAMSVARPVVAFDVGGQREWLEDGVTGLVVRPATAEALAQGIRALLADPLRCRRMGEAGRERVQRLYRPEAHIERLLQVFARAAA